MSRHWTRHPHHEHWSRRRSGLTVRCFEHPRLITLQSRPRERIRVVHFAGASAPPSHILQGDDLTWLDLILVGALPPRYERPASEDVVAPLLPTLQVADSVGPEMFAAGHVELFDPEGVLLARLHLDDAKTHRRCRGWSARSRLSRGSTISTTQTGDSRRGSSLLTGQLVRLWRCGSGHRCRLP